MLMKITGHLTTGQLGRYVHIMSDDVTDALDPTEPAEGAKPLPPDNTQETVASLKAKSKAARLNGGRAMPAMADIPLANPVKESLPRELPIEVVGDMISAPAEEPSPAAVVFADPALVSLGSNVIRFPVRKAA
jgi:hypothetical protein